MTGELLQEWGGQARALRLMRRAGNVLRERHRMAALRWAFGALRRMGCAPFPFPFPFTSAT